MKINLQELECLAISPEIPILGEVATLKQLGDKLVVTQYRFDDALASEIERLLAARYPLIRVEVQQQNPEQLNPEQLSTSKDKFKQRFGRISIETPQH